MPKWECIFYRVQLESAKDYWLLILDDVSELKKEAIALKEQSMVDQLTSLYNRKKLDAIEKSELPHKIWSDCLQCPKFPDCDEDALIWRNKGS